MATGGYSDVSNMGLGKREGRNVQGWRPCQDAHRGEGKGAAVGSSGVIPPQSNGTVVAVQQPFLGGRTYSIAVALPVSAFPVLVLFQREADWELTPS